MMNPMRGAFRLAALVCACVVVLLPSATLAQVRVSEWQTYSSLQNVRATASDRTGKVWAATSGGVFSYDLQTRSTQEFRNINALYGIDITAIAVSPLDGSIYAGGFNGALNVYNGKNWSVVTDILTANLTRKKINGFLFQDSLVFIAGDFGLTIFDPKRRVFTETVQRFSTLQPGSAAKQILVSGGRIWVATENGVVSATTGLRSYANPASWTLHPFVGDVGAAGMNTVSIAEVQGVLYTTQGANLWQMANNRFEKLITTFFEPIRSLASVQNQLFIATENFLYNTAKEGLTTSARTMNSLTVIDSAGQKRLAVNTGQGFAIWTSPQSQFIRLSSPVDNRFRSITVDTKGGVWCVSGSSQQSAIPNDGSSTGISVFRDSVWRVFTAETHPAMRVNSYYQIDAQPNGTVWASSFGGGTLLIQPDSNFHLTNFNTAGTGILPSAGDTFSVLGQVQTDTRTGTLWLPNYQTGTDQIIIARTAQGVFKGFSRPVAERRYHFLAIDRSGTKWFSTWRGTEMLAFNERSTFDNTSDDVWYSVPTGVLNEGQSCIAADKDDRIWIGTPRAMYSIVNPSYVLTQASNQSLIIDKPRKLVDQAYNAIAVDALNYKWFGTNNGVIVYDSQRDTILARFTTDNSPLASNTVLSIAIDNNSGKIYFGTDNGMSVATTLSIRPNTDFTTMRCYPQPFVPAQDNELVIDGLAEGTQVKISTVDGLLVRAFTQTNSRTVVWDGLDEQRRPVQSGVYIISAYSDTVGANAVIKAMVIQK
ncbi:MAG: hypothetical protein JNN25_05930 [Candidatus Kapabacteria bacterium]|nr:hypothetical protein [Candidatus Kapabacteria bacterium]